MLRQFKHGSGGYSVAATEAQARAISADPDVAYVEENGIVTGNAVQTNAPWGVDRLDQFSLPLSGTYENYGGTGAGVTIYIVDSGIRTTHQQFGGRAYVGADFINDGLAGKDGHGHGSHVAGLAGGSTYGVAKQVSLCSVRVLGTNNRGTVAGIMSGIEWVINNRSGPCVMNLSLDADASSTLDEWVRNAVAAGITTVVAAGNRSGDAGLYSPSRVAEAIVVGSTSSTDARAGDSNFGTSVDLFAPGVSLASANYTSDTATITFSGTSMAAPHVAGLAALYLQVNPAASPAQVEAALIANASLNRISNPGTGSPTRLARIITYPENNSDLSFLARQPGVKTVSGDFNGDGKAEFALLGGSKWNRLPVALSNGNGTFTVKSEAVTSFNSWAGASGVKVLTGDFNGDGKTDIALFGGANPNSIPVALSNGSGGFTIVNTSNSSLTGFIGLAPAAPAYTGDFNGDGRTDFALVGGPGWTTIPIAFSNGSGGFTSTNEGVGSFGSSASSSKPVVGDFNADGKADIALIGGSGWRNIPLATSQGNGKFTVTQQVVGDFASLAPAAKVTPGDFNGDGKLDVALVGGPGWTTIPIAFSTTNGNFTISNRSGGDFALIADSDARVVAGRFDANARTDIALVGGPGWTTTPLAFSLGSGTFSITNSGAGNFPTWARQSAQLFSGDFDGDGLTDVALIGGTNWTNLRISFTRSGGTFSITDQRVQTPQ